MQYAGVAVLVRSDRLETACMALDALHGVEVRRRHADGRRLIVVVEAEDATAHKERLESIHGVPGVLVAAPVFHYVGDPADPEVEAAATSTPEAAGQGEV